MTKKRSTTSRLNAVDYLIFIICSLASLAMFYLFYRDMNSFTIKQSEDPIAKIYFKRNTAQRKFLDGDIWEVLTSSSDVYDGDRIRTSNNSEAYTEFSDGAAKIQLNEKSMIQIFQNKNERSINFIGGEIFVESNVAGDDKLVIRSGKTEISISSKAEVKVALPEASESTDGNPEESVIVVEVVSGQVEVSD
ncbi:MAG: FecR domain-containing protein, partial [Treponema sp.]|nr:FecR domain-containing protein [Treponema sp.]